MSEQNKTLELKDEDLAKVTGGSNDYLPGSGWYEMYTSSMIKIKNTGGHSYKRKDSGEEFYVSSISDNGIPGSLTPVSTTYYFKSESSSACFSFTAEKNGANICYDLE